MTQHGGSLCARWRERIKQRVSLSRRPTWYLNPMQISLGTPVGCPKRTGKHAILLGKNEREEEERTRMFQKPLCRKVGLAHEGEGRVTPQTEAAKTSLCTGEPAPWFFAQNLKWPQAKNFEIHEVSLHSYFILFLSSAHHSVSLFRPIPAKIHREACSHGAAGRRAGSSRKTSYEIKAPFANPRDLDKGHVMSSSFRCFTEAQSYN